MSGTPQWRVVPMRTPRQPASDFASDSAFAALLDKQIAEMERRLIAAKVLRVRRTP